MDINDFQHNSLVHTFNQSFHISIFIAFRRSGLNRFIDGLKNLVPILGNERNIRFLNIWDVSVGYFVHFNVDIKFLVVIFFVPHQLLPLILFIPPKRANLRKIPHVFSIILFFFHFLFILVFVLLFALSGCLPYNNI